MVEHVFSVENFFNFSCLSKYFILLKKKKKIGTYMFSVTSVLEASASNVFDWSLLWPLNKGCYYYN